ncbi:MAG: Fic family protein [Rhodopila sp.]|nr:Fic family protein [Rhodopila sp.]
MNRSELSHQVRAALKRLPPPYANHYGVVPFPPPASPPSVMAVAAQCHAALNALARLETLVSELGDPWLVSRILMRREAISSSAIEGTNSTLDELLSAEETGDTWGRQAAAQVKDYALCLDAVVPSATALGPSVFTDKLVRDLHRSAMKSETGYADTPGELRTNVVWIGGRGDIAYSTYNPAPPEDIGRCLADNIAYMRGDADETFPPSVITRMAVAHAHFEAVHPFTDGNGRVGRLLLPLMMAAQGHAPLYLSPYIEANRSAYYAALKAAQQRHLWREMIGFVADAVTATVSELLATRRALQDLRAIWLLRRRFRARSAALRTLDVLPHYPVITAGRLAELLDVSGPQAAQAVRQLMDVGILWERTGYRRNRLFAASEALSIINRPFGEEPVLPSPNAIEEGTQPAIS